MQISSMGKKVEQPKSKAKKYVLIGLIVSAILLVILLILLIILQNFKPARAMVLNIDGEEKEYEKNTFIITQDNEIYISLMDVANLIGYRYYDGAYKQSIQDQEMCYLESDDEIVVFEYKSDKIYKTLNDGQIQYSEYTISKPVAKDNNKLYIISTGLMKACNIYLSYDSKNNVMSIKTLPGIYDAYSNKIKSGDYGKINGTIIEEISEDFSNKKGILYNMLVVGSTIKNEKKYGVISNDGNQVFLGIKFDSIEFIEAAQAFLVSEKDVNGNIKYGLKNKDGKDKIEIKYDNIKILDGENQLYYVNNNEKSGVVNENGDIVIFVENDQIGINPNQFTKDNIKNPMLLLDRYIPVKRNMYWALYDTEGKQISDFNIEELGYIVDNKSYTGSKINGDNLLLIKDIDGIIVKKDGKYGVITVEQVESRRRNLCCKCHI